MQAIILGKLQYFLNDFWGYLLAIIIILILSVLATVTIFRLKRPETQKRLFIAGFFTLLLLVFIYTGFEAYIRYVFDESDSLGFLRVSGRWFQRHVTVNADNYRDRNFSTQKKPGTFRIGVIGDSITFGYGIKDPEKRFSNILEKKLREAGVEAEVYNLGRPGYDTHNQLTQFAKLDQFNFDMIVWQYFFNDAQPPYGRGSELFIKNREQGKLASWLSDHSYFFDYIYWRIMVRYNRTFSALGDADLQAYHDRKNIDNHKRDITAFIWNATHKGEDLLVIIFPYLYLLPDNPMEEERTLVRQIFRQRGVATIDLLEDLKGRRALDLVGSKYDYHPNEYVHQLAAERLFQKILPIVTDNQKKDESN